MAALTLILLGTFEVVRDGAPVTRFRGDKVRALLAYLATEADRPHARTSLATLLWPDQTTDQALRNLTQTVVRLREALGDEGVVHTTRHHLQWQADVARVDVQDFVRLARSTNFADRVRAADVYSGEFLPGFAVPTSDLFEEWLLLTREQLHKEAGDLFGALATQSEAVGDYVALCRYARRHIELEPWHEPAHRKLMRGLALLGDRNAALAHYERCRALLASELGVEPEVETRSLYERIRADSLTLASPADLALRHNLPPQLTAFIGREAELSELATLLEQPNTRLLTLVGAGGMGKTRLALEVARASLNSYADGVYFVALAQLTTPSELPSAIAQAINLPSGGGEPLTALLHFLRDKHMLLVLDNFEHLLEAADFVVNIIGAAPRVQVLATSRERLNLRGEQRYEVNGLPYSNQSRSDDAPLEASAHLFVQSARRIEHTFTLHASNRATVLRICQLVQGMPLGLELAAAGIEMLSLPAIVAEIERSADVLATDWRDAPPRQRSMRAIFDWSWRLLTADEQRIFRQLSIFRDGFSRDAAQAATGASLLMLTRLVQKSLVRASGERYEVHELVRQYAAEQLDVDSNEHEAVDARHSAYYLAFVAARERLLARDEPQKAAADFQREISNIRQAWTWAAGAGRVRDLDRSTYSIWQLYTMVGPISEGIRLFELAAEGIRQHLNEGSRNETDKRYAYGVLSKVVAIRASLLLSQGNNDLVLEQTAQAIALAQQSSDGTEGMAIGTLVQGQALRRKGYSSQARERLLAAAHLAQQARVAGVVYELLPEVEWRAYNWLCSITLTQDDYPTAKRYAEAAVDLCRTLGKRIGEIRCLTDIIDIAIATGEYTVARRESQYLLDLAHTVSYHRGLTVIRLMLSNIGRLQGEYSFAYEMGQQGVAGCREAGDILNESYGVRYLTYLHLFMGDYAGTRQWLDAYSALMRVAGMPAREVFLGLLPLALLAHAVGDNGQALAHAELAWQMAQELDGRSSQGYALVVLGVVYASLQRFVEARTAYENALDIYTELGHPHLAAEPQAGLAQLALERGDLSLAHHYVEDILQTLGNYPRAGLNEPFGIYIICYRVLAAIQDPRAATVAQLGYDILQHYASHITDPVLRLSFLHNVATHREVIHIYELLR